MDWICACHWALSPLVAWCRMRYGLRDGTYYNLLQKGVAHSPYVGTSRPSAWQKSYPLSHPQCPQSIGPWLTVPINYTSTLSQSGSGHAPMYCKIWQHMLGPDMTSWCSVLPALQRLTSCVWAKPAHCDLSISADDSTSCSFMRNERMHGYQDIWGLGLAPGGRQYPNTHWYEGMRPSRNPTHISSPICC